jgi:hypothetical protein
MRFLCHKLLSLTSGLRQEKARGGLPYGREGGGARGLSKGAAAREILLRDSLEQQPQLYA